MAREVPVFISYARSDGENYAQQLQQRLKEHPKVALWQDRIRMSPGDFEQQLKQAIETAEYLVVVITPGALRSEWVEKEWRYARQKGVCICPIKPTFQSASEESELRELRAKWPRWMQQIQTFDFEGYWDRFVAVLQSPCQATRAPFLPPSLPSNFVKRPAESSRIIDGILDKNHKNPSGKNVVLYGSGGFGKTSLALDVCHNEDVFAAFDGGILWATLGEKHSTIPELTKIYDALTGDRPLFANQDDAMVAVSQKLAGKRCLLVIDDVWEERDLKPFLQGGDQTSRLITTRRFNIAVNVAEESNRVNVAELRPNEAEELLTTRLQPTSALLPQFRELAARLGEWPLLLQLANRVMLEQIALRNTVEGALEWVNNIYKERGVGGFDREDAKEREEAIAKTVDLSLSLLKEDRERCLELAIFPEDTDIPLDVIGLVWQRDATSTQILAQRMNDLALIRLDLSRTSGAVQTSGSVRIHDAMRTFFASQLANPATLHARLADAWKDPTRLKGEYARQYVAYHLAEAMADRIQVVQRGQQLLDLLTDSRYRGYRDQHGDPLALHRQLLLALKRAAQSLGSDAPALVPALALLVKSFAQSKHNPDLFFGAATAGKVREAEQRLDVFDAEPEWRTLARLLIAWIATPQNSGEAKALVEAVATSCDGPELQSALTWVQRAPDGVPDGLPPILGSPQSYVIEAILRRAGGAEMGEGMEPVHYSRLVSGLPNDTSGFMAEQDAPALVAFARLDPASNTQTFERYIGLHAANRYRYYRNRSLWALLKSVLSYPDAPWVRQILQRIVKAAFTPTEIDFEESLPIAVWGLLASLGDQAASNKLQDFGHRLFVHVTGMPPGLGAPRSNLNDSWSHYQRRACALAEVYALALDHKQEAESFLQLARQLPKGFAGFRSFAALTLAESIQLVTPGERSHIDEAMQSAQAAAHRIQDYPFCVRTTAMVNAIRLRWLGNGVNLEEVITDFLKDPLAERFCGVHLVLEDYAFRYSDSRFESLPIPEAVLKAQTLNEIAESYRMQPKEIARVNAEIAPDKKLNKNDEVSIPDPDFAPILAARFAAAVLAAPNLADDRCTALIQSLVPPSIPNRTALDTLLQRLLLSARKTKFEMPGILASLDVPRDSEPATSSGALIA
jgi:hypothetical protein